MGKNNSTSETVNLSIKNLIVTSIQEVSESALANLTQQIGSSAYQVAQPELKF